MGKELFISVDIEASGPVPGTYSMLALGACVVTNCQDRFYVELKPISQASVPAAGASGREKNTIEPIANLLEVSSLGD